MLKAFADLNRFELEQQTLVFIPVSILLCPGTFSFSILCSMLRGHASGKHGMVMNGVTEAPDTSKRCNDWARWPTSIRHDHTVILPLPSKRIKTLLHFYTQKNAKQTSSNSFVLSMLHHKNKCISSTCFWVPVQMTASICTRLPLQSCSPERRQLQPLRHWPWAVSAFWCPAKRHFDASFGRKHVASPLPLHAFWKPGSDYLLLLTISVFNAKNIMWDWNVIWRSAT